MGTLPVRLPQLLSPTSTMPLARFTLLLSHMFTSSPLLPSQPSLTQLPLLPQPSVMLETTAMLPPPQPLLTAMPPPQPLLMAMPLPSCCHCPAHRRHPSDPCRSPDRPCWCSAPCCCWPSCCWPWHRRWSCLCSPVVILASISATIQRHL